MLPSTSTVTEVTATPLQSNTSFWLNGCMSLPAKHCRNDTVWTSDWVKCLQAGIEKENLSTIINNYKQLAEQLNNLLQYPPSEEDNQDEWISSLLLHLVIMHVYQEIVEEINVFFIEPNLTPWVTQQITQVIMCVSQTAFSNQLRRLVEYIHEQPINNKVDRALLKIHQHTVTHYFQQFLDCLSEPEACRSPDKENDVFKSYLNTIQMLYAYTTQFSQLPYTEKEYIANLGWSQLEKLIKKTSTLILTPSWTERLKEWLQKLFKQLWYLPTTGVEIPSSQALLAISRRLQKTAKKGMRNQSSQSIRLIRERCWLYFSLHEHLISQCEYDEKLSLEYQATSLALLQSFISTFDKVKFKQEVLYDNPLKPKFSLFTFKSKQVTPIGDWETLVDIGLKKLCKGLFLRDRFGRWDKKDSFLLWLVARHKPRLLAKIENYIMHEKEEFECNEILFLDKRNLYRLVQEIHEDIRADLNQLTQVILNTWFQEVGLKVSHADLGRILAKPECWLHYKNLEVFLGSKCPIHRFAHWILDAVERLGVGLYFFPPLQQRWSRLQAALENYQGNNAEFILDYYADISAILNKLLLMFHPDQQSNAIKDSIKIKNRAIKYLPQIKEAKERFQQFKERDIKEIHDFTIDVEVETDCLLDTYLEGILLNCMDCHVKYERWQLNLLSLQEKELEQNYSQETYETIFHLKQLEAHAVKVRQETKEALGKINKETKKAREETANERKEKEAAQAEIENERKEKEAAQAREAAAKAEIKRLKELLALINPEQVSPPPQVKQLSLATSCATLFSASNVPSVSTNTVAKNRDLTEYRYAP